MASKQTIISPTKEVAIPGKSSKKRKEITDTQSICNNIARSINMCKDVVFGKSLPTVKGRVIGGDPKNVLDSLIAEEIYLANITDLLEDSTTFKDLDFANVLDTTIVDEFEEVFPKFSLDYQPKGIGIMTIEKRYYAFVNCDEFVLSFENLPTLTDATALLINQHSKRTALVLSSTKAFNDPTNLLTSLMLLFGILQFSVEDVLSCLRDNIPITEILDNKLIDTIDEEVEEDEPLKEEPSQEDEPLKETPSKEDELTREEPSEETKLPDPALINKLLPALNPNPFDYDSPHEPEYDVPVYQLPAKVITTIADKGKEEDISDYEMITKVLFDLVDSILPDFRLSHVALVTIIVTQLASLIILYRNLKIKMIGFKSLVTMQIVGLLSTIYVFLIHGKYIPEDHDISLGRIRSLLSNYFNPPKEYYNLTDNPQTLVLHSPTAAQLVQVRTSDLEFYQKFKDSQLIDFLVPYPSRLLTYLELAEVKEKARSCTQQVKLDDASVLLDKFLGPIGFVFALLSCHPKSLFGPALKNLFSVVDNAKKYSKSLTEIKEQLMNFFLPQESYVTKIIQQREENLKAIQPSLAHLAIDHKAYQRLLRAKQESAALFQGIMHQNGKNEMFRLFTQSVSAVDVKIFEFQKLVEHSVGRQEPVGIHFYGDVGIGKTTFITRQLCGILANRLGLNPNTYNVKINPDGFYGVYGAEAFAYMDEVGDSSDSGPEFALINTLMSSISQHIPSAFVKEQPFLSKFLLLISNYNLQEVSGTIKKKARTATAFRSRFIEIHVTNPAVKSNSSRGNDPSCFSNENFRFSMTRYNLDDTSTTTSITLNQLVDLMVEEYEKKHQAFKEHLKRFPEIQAGPRGSPMSIGIVGPQGTGKTQLAHELLEDFNSLETETVIIEKCADFPKVFKPASVVLLNDLITAETLKNEQDMQCLHQLENLGTNGVVINTSNVVPKQLPWYYFFTNWTLFKMLCMASYVKKRFTLPIIYQQLFSQEGLYRRTGYTGTFWHNNSVLIVNGASVLTINSHEGFEFVFDNNSYTATNAKNAIYERIQSHRGMKQHHFRNTNMEERVSSDWNIFIWAENMQTFIERWASFNLSQLGIEVRMNSIAIKQSALSNTNVNPDVLLNKRFTAENFITEIYSLIAYLTTTNIHLKINIRIGENYFWNEGLSIYTNYEIPTFEVKNDLNGFSADGVDFSLQELKDFYIENIPNPSLRKQILLTKLQKSMIVPCVIQERLQRHIEERGTVITISKTQALYNAMKTEFSHSPIFYIATFLFFLLSSTLLIKFLLPNKKTRKTRQQAVTYNKGFGRSKASGHRYMTLNGKVIYSDDEAQFNEVRYQDYGENESDSEVYQQANEERLERTVIIPEKQFVNYHNILSKNTPRKNIKLVLPEGTNYKGVRLTVRNTAAMHESFEVTGRDVWTCDYLSDILTLDNNVNAMGFNNIEHMMSVIDPQKRYVYITITKTPTLSVIGLSAADIDLLKQCKEQYICSIIQQPIAFNKICNINTGEIIPCSFEEINFEPKTFVGIKKYRLKKKYYRIINFPKQQMLSTPVRIPDDLDLLSKTLKNNAVTVTSDLGRVGGFYVEEGFVLTVRHVMSSNLAIEEENRKTLEVERVYYPDNEADYMLLRVKGSTGHPSLLNRFTFLENAVRTECKLVSFSYESDICANLSSTATDQPILNGTISLYKANTILIGPSSSIPTKAGDCGRPYVTTNKYLRPSIVGIHVAASAHDLFASKVDPTWLKTICRASQQALLRYDVPGFTGNLQLIGKNQRTINSPSKPYSFPSKLSKYMSDIVPSMKRPAKTSIDECTPEEIAKLAVDANGTPDFYLGQILQYNDPIKDLPAHTCKAYVSGFTARYHQEMVRDRVGNVLRPEEILNGIMTPNDPLYGFANGMNWNGSIGYEAQTKYQHCHIMSDIVEHTAEGAVFNDSPCAQFVQSKIDRHLQASWEGLKIDDILQDNLKQENRENEKAYKQRVFTSFPKSLSALVRFFLLRFSAMLTKHHGDMPFKIGVNSNAEWHFEMMKDISFGGSNAKGFGFDLSRCDKHMGAFFFVDVLLPIFSYPVVHAHKTNTCNCNHSLEEHLNAIKVVVEHLYNNLIASQDMLYRKTRGNSSGSDLTILINSIYVDFMVYAWFRNTARRFKVFPPTYTAYEEIIRRMLCGDDGKILVALCGQKLLTFESFKNFCAHYGVLVDTPEKDGSTDGLRPVLDIPFISRKWVLSPHGFYLAKFKIEIISGLCYWTRYDTTEQYDEALRTLSAFICPYGEEMYTKFYNAALLYQGDYLSHYVVPTYKEALFDLERQIPGLAVLQYQSKKNSSFENNLKMYFNNSENKNQFSSRHERNSVFLTANGLKRLEHHVERDGIYTTSIFRPVSIRDKDVDWRRNVRDVFEQYAEISSEFAEKYGQAYKYDCHSTRSELELNSLIVEFAHKLSNDWQTIPNDSDHLLLHNNNAYFIAKAQFALALLSLAEEARELFPDRYYSESYLDWLVNTIFPLPLDFFTNLPKVQMERNTTAEMNQTPMHQTQPSMNNMTSVNTVAIGDAMTMTVPHLPQLATVVAPPAIPVLENMPIDNTIDMRNPQQTRTIGLPADLIAYGGVLETIEDVAKGSYQIVNTYTINVNQQAGTEIFRIPYGLDLLGGYNLAWTNLHQRYTGPILVKFTIISNSIVQGRIRIGWDIDPAVKNNSNSSKYGAADFDLSQSSNVVVMELNPVAEATGRNFFRVGETPVGQPYLYGVLITPLTNNFSDLGNIQILVESRLAPGFIVADPIDVTPITGTRTLVSNSTSIDYLFKDLDVTQTTVYLESRKYPKFPNYPANVYASNVELKATDPVFQLESDLRPGDYPTITVDNTHHFTDTVNCAISGPPRGKPLRNTKLSAHLTGTVNNAVLNDINLAAYGDVDLTGDALLSYNVNLDDSTTPHIVHGTAITIDTTKFPARSNGTSINKTLAFTTGATDVITGEQHDVALDSKLLPIGYVACEFADVTTPSVRASAVAPGNNIIPRNTFGWILHNYCYQNCPSDGQIKVSIVDKVFQENLIEILYRPEIGFYTKAPQDKFYTFFNANIGNYKISAAVVSSQSALSLNVDLGNFVSFVQPAQQQMFQLAGNLGRGLEDGLFGLSSIDRKGYQDRQNIYAQGSQTRQNMAYQQQLNNFGSNLYHSPMNGAASIMSYPNTRQGTSFASMQQNRQSNYISNLSPTTMGCQTPQTYNSQGNMRQNVMPGSPGMIISHTGTLMGNQK